MHVQSLRTFIHDAFPTSTAQPRAIRSRMVILGEISSVAKLYYCRSYPALPRGREYCPGFSPSFTPTVSLTCEPEHQSRGTGHIAIPSAQAPRMGHRGKPLSP